MPDTRTVRHRCWKKYRKLAHNRAYYVECFYCRLKMNKQDFTVEHLCPKFYGGNNHVSNLRPACRSCNMEVGLLVGKHLVDTRERRRKFFSGLELVKKQSFAGATFNYQGLKRAN